MYVKVANCDIQEALHHYVSAGFSPKIAGNDEIILTPGQADHDTLLKAVNATRSLYEGHKTGSFTVLSGRKGRPFRIPRV